MRDSAISSLSEKNGDVWLINLRNNYENKQLKEIVLEQTTAEKYLETSQKIIQKSDPGFMKPLSTSGRAHFYAPCKKIGNLEIDTFWFNVMVIWSVSLLLYTALYFKILRRIISYFENFRSQKSEIDRLSFVIELPE